MPTGSEDVGLSGQSGSGRRAAKTTRLTHNGRRANYGAHFAERTSADNRYDYKAEMLVAWSKWAKHIAELSEGAAMTDISEAERLALMREFRPPPSGLPLFLWPAPFGSIFPFYLKWWWRIIAASRTFHGPGHGN
jgi:hypothetical protein